MKVLYCGYMVILCTDFYIISYVDVDIYLYPVLITFLVCTDGVTAGSPTLCIVVGHVVDVVVVG